MQFPGTDGYVNGDFNYDGVIDGADYGIIDNTVQLQGAPFPGVVFARAGCLACRGEAGWCRAAYGVLATATFWAPSRKPEHEVLHGCSPLGEGQTLLGASNSTFGIEVATLCLPARDQHPQ